MAQDPNNPIKLDEAELDALARVAKPKLSKYSAYLSGLKRGRTITHYGNYHYAGLREYHYGDEMRLINWRASMRSKQFQIHLHEKEIGSRWLICLDASASMSLPDSRKWHLAIALSQAFAYILLAGGNQVGLMAFSDKVDRLCPCGSGRQHYKNLHQLLRQIRPKPFGGDSTPETCVSHLKPQTSVILISDFLRADAMTESLERFHKAGHRLHLLHILAEHETNLPASGIVNLTDSETGETIGIELTGQTRELAAQWLRGQCASLGAFCAERRMHYSFSSTDQDWKTIVLNHILAL